MRPPRGIDPALLRSQVDLLQPVDARRFVVSSVFVTALVTATRWPLRSHYLFSWDAANFAQALDSYNVAFHRPHPPGYPLYVLDPAGYGALNTYGGVVYYPRNPLLDAAGGGDLADGVFRMPSAVDPKEIRVVSALVDANDVGQGTDVSELTLRSASGAVVGQYRCARAWIRWIGVGTINLHPEVFVTHMLMVRASLRTN